MRLSYDELINASENEPYGFKISFPHSAVLQDVPGAASHDSLVLGHLDDDPKANPALDCCYKQGWLQAETSISWPQDRIQSDHSISYPTGPFWRQEHLVLKNLVSNTVKLVLNPDVVTRQAT